MRHGVIWIFMIIQFPAVIWAEEIHYLDPSSPSAAKVIVKITDEKGNFLPACLTLKNASGNALWGLDAQGKQMTYRFEPRLWISGNTILDVTADTYQYWVTRPFAYRSASGIFSSTPGKTHSLEVRLEKIIDMPNHGWYGGDAHQHIVHGEKEFAVNAEIAAHIAQAEGADWCSFNSGWSSIPGDQPIAADVRNLLQHASNSRFLALLGDEYPKDHLGHMACLPGPLRDWEQFLGKNDYSYPPGQHEFFTHFEILRPLLKSGGLAVYTHPLREYGGTLDSPANLSRELPFDLLAAPDLIPTVDWMTDNPYDPNAMKLWSMFLNWGYRIGICAFSDTCYDRHDAAPLIKRTYVYLGENKPTSAHLIQAIREGHTFGTTGPLLLVDIDGQPPGTAFGPTNISKTLHIQAYSPGIDYTNRSHRPFLDRVEIIRNGETYRLFDLSNKQATEFEQRLEIQEKAEAWYIVKAFTSGNTQVAITSPFYFLPKNYSPPQPTPAVVQVIVEDAATGERISAAIDAVDYSNNNPQTHIIDQAGSEKGHYEIQCNATQRLRVQAKGYKSQTLSLFLDDPAIYLHLILPTRAKDMLNPDYYERIRRALQNATLHFRLERI